MQVSSNEQLRIQSVLYPWVLFSVLNEQIEPCIKSIVPGRNFPRYGAFSFTEETGKSVIWDVQQREVSILDLVDLRSPVLQGKVGFSFQKNLPAVRFYEDGKLQLSSFRKLTQLGSWVHFLKWLLSTQNDLGVANWEKVSSTNLLRKVMLTLIAAVAGLNGLAQVDPFSKSLLHHLPDGVILIHIDGVGDTLGRIQIQDGQLRWLKADDFPAGHSVDFRFKSLEIAWKSVANLADNLAAVGLGDIHLRGYIPLADGFNHMLDRLQMFVKAS